MSSLSHRIIVSAGLLAAFALGGCSTEPLSYSHDYQKQGLREYDGGDYVQAIGAFQVASRQDPTDYRTQFYLGRCYEATNSFHEAVESYKLCLELMPNTPVGRMDVATHDKAFESLAELIGKNPAAEPEIDELTTHAATNKSADDYHLLGRIFAIKGDPDSAIDAYHHALAIAPDDFKLNKEFGLYLAKIDQTTEAAQVLRHAWELNNSDKEVTSALAQLGLSQTQLGGAPVAPAGGDFAAPRD